MELLSGSQVLGVVLGGVIVIKAVQWLKAVWTQPVLTLRIGAPGLRKDRKRIA